MENSELYQRTLAALIAEYGPRSETEHLLVERLANLFWRERRLIQAERNELVRIEGDIFTRGSGGSTSLPISNQILIGRDQTMLSNQITSTVIQLERLLQISEG